MREKQHVALKHWCLPTSLHVIITQKNDIINFTAARTSNLKPQTPIDESKLKVYNVMADSILLF
jgi:hypothetical protein